MKRVELEPAFVLHTRAYRETSLIVEVFGRHTGRFALIAKGVRRPKSALRGMLQSFHPLLLSWSGSGELGCSRAPSPTDICGHSPARHCSAVYISMSC